MNIYEYAQVEKESSPKRNSINKGVEKEIMISDMLMWQCQSTMSKKGRQETEDRKLVSKLIK